MRSVLAWKNIPMVSESKATCNCQDKREKTDCPAIYGIMACNATPSASEKVALLLVLFCVTSQNSAFGLHFVEDKHSEKHVYVLPILAFFT